MSITPAQSPTPPAVIHRNERIHAAQYRAEKALDTVRSSAWSAGAASRWECAREERAAHDLTAALADLVALALGVES